MRDWHVMRGDGDGTTVYFGRHQGARYISVDLRGFNGWQTSRRMPGGFAFFNPTLRTGRLFCDASRSWSIEVLIPAAPVDLWRKRKRAYREALREKPIPASTAKGGSE